MPCSAFVAAAARSGRQAHTALLPQLVLQLLHTHLQRRGLALAPRHLVVVAATLLLLLQLEQVALQPLIPLLVLGLVTRLTHSS